MLAFEEALDAIARRCAPLDVCETALPDATGTVLAQALCAPHDMPQADNAAMDGYAVRADDLQYASDATPVALELCETIGAGHTSTRAVTAGTCAAIMTGAELPPGADAIVQIEATRRRGSRVEFTAPVPRGAWIRRRGAEARTGDVLAPAGQVITPAVIGMAASCGRTSVRVHRRPRVACVITGDEIAAPGTLLRAGQKHDALGPALCAAAERDGCEVTECSHAPDDPARLQTCLQEGLAAADVLLIVGGASVGAFDYVQEALRGLHVEEVFWKVAVKPGKPLWYGVRDSTHVFNLPGNPVSALVTYYVFARFAIRLLQGRTRADAMLPERHAVLDDALENDEPRVEFVRGVMRSAGGEVHVRPIPARCSSMLSSLAHANALIICPPRQQLAAATKVCVWELPCV